MKVGITMESENAKKEKRDIIGIISLVLMLALSVMAGVLLLRELLGDKTEATLVFLNTIWIGIKYFAVLEVALWIIYFFTRKHMDITFVNTATLLYFVTVIVGFIAMGWNMADDILELVIVTIIAVICLVVPEFIIMCIMPSSRPATQGNIDTKKATLSNYSDYKSEKKSIIPDVSVKTRSFSDEFGNYKGSATTYKVGDHEYTQFKDSSGITRGTANTYGNRTKIERR